MKNKNTIVVIGVIVLIVGLTALYLVKRAADKKKEKEKFDLGTVTGDLTPIADLDIPVTSRT